MVLGAAPSVANGIIAGVDHVPPPLLRAARTMGPSGSPLPARLLPAALPTYVSGLKQGWAFAWRSLMAGELLVIIAHHPSLGVLLSTDQNSDMAAMIAIMIVILVIGMVVDIAFNAGRTPPSGGGGGCRPGVGVTAAARTPGGRQARGGCTGRTIGACRYRGHRARWRAVVADGDGQGRAGMARSTLLRRTVGILARVTDGPVVVVRAPGQDCRRCRRRSRSWMTRARA